MNVSWFRFLRTLYRQEPITGFILTAGAMNVAIGGFDQSTPLVMFGLGTVALSILFRWWALSQRPAPVRVSPEPSPRMPVRALPERSSRPSLPELK
ncbi:hypothetical protein ACQ4M3_15305 [Leptolyngbya sp. AN03gr2]|uniref:hypothetical protein n=1 Tax=unclassified Leptolyngbya TaxID=2650499 RepID=UPI003D318FC0